MTPERRKAMHDALDTAINLGASIDINIHIEYTDDIPAFDFLAPVAEAKTNTLTSERYQLGGIWPMQDITVYRTMALQKGARR